MYLTLACARVAGVQPDVPPNVCLQVDLLRHLQQLVMLLLRVLVGQRHVQLLLVGLDGYT